MVVMKEVVGVVSGNRSGSGCANYPCINTLNDIKTSFKILMILTYFRSNKCLSLNVKKFT